MYKIDKIQAHREQLKQAWFNLSMSKQMKIH